MASLPTKDVMTRYARTRARIRYCAAWPEELKDLSRRHYRAVCRVRCLEAALTRTDPSDLDVLMDQLEAARQEVYALSSAFRRMKYDWELRSDNLQI